MDRVHKVIEEALRGLDDGPAPEQIAVVCMMVAVKSAVEGGHGECDERKAAFLELASRAWDREVSRQRRRLLS